MTLKNIIEKHFPEEYRKRMEEEKSHESNGLGTAMIPLFCMDVVLPHQRMALNIFEPRYRLLIRRAMSGSRTFGMIGFERNDILDVGCEVTIEECQCLPDGRFAIEVVGVRRFKVKKCEEQDGYRLAHAQYMTDHSDHSEESVRELLNLAKEVEEKLDTFLQRVGQRSGRRESAILNALTRSAGKKPTLPSERSNESILSWCEDLSFYAGTLLGTIQVVSTSRLIQTTSTKERLTLLHSSTVLNC